MMQGDVDVSLRHTISMAMVVTSVDINLTWSLKDYDGFCGDFCEAAHENENPLAA